MSLRGVIDGLGAYLLGAVTPTPASAGGVEPNVTGDLPAVVISLAEATRVLVGIGRIPRPPRTGALEVTTSIDLADPVLRFPGEPDVPLLTSGRTTLQLPHAPLVTADGSPDAAFGAADLTATVGATTYTVVTAAPTGNQVRPTPQTGILTFGSELPPGGTLNLTYFIGQWEVKTARYQGVLAVKVFAAAAAAVSDLSGSVDGALLREPAGSVPGLRSIAPLSWGGVVPYALPGPPAGAARARTMTYRIDYEVEDAVVPTGGGVISLVAVRGHVDDESEPPELEFDVTG